MFDNSIRGGQIFWHQLTMFKQVLLRSLSMSMAISLLIVVFLTLPKLAEHDFPAAITYSKAELAVWFHENKIVLHKNALTHLVTIDAYDKRGLYAKNIRAHTILEHNRFKAEAGKVMELIISSLLLALAIAAGSLALIFIIWSVFGKKAKKTMLLKGGVILNAKEVARVLLHKKLASHIKIGDMPLVKDAETKHILITGATGTGKTNLFHTILPQIRSKNQPALIIDQTGEMINRYYDPARGDAIFNPFDTRSYAWDFFEEIAELPRLNSLASSIFCNSKVPDMMWNNASKQVFIDCATVIKNAPKPTIAKLYELIAHMPLKDASQKLQGYASSALLSPAGDRTAMSIRSNTISFINWLEYLPEACSDKDNKNKFTIKDWIPDTINANEAHSHHRDISGRWLFISSRPEERALMKPLQSILLDLVCLSIQKLEPDRTRRFWIIADELASLKKLDILPQSLSELRKYGGCIMTALQSLNQLYEIYGQNNASTMFGQFATKFMFRTSESLIAKMISDMFGSALYREQQQNTSYGAHEHRDGISYTEQEKRKALVTVDDLASLADLECFVELPEPSVRCARIKMPIIKNPSSDKKKGIKDDMTENLDSGKAQREPEVITQDTMRALLNRSLEEASLEYDSCKVLENGKPHILVDDSGEEVETSIETKAEDDTALSK